MTSTVEICNLALSNLGKDNINAIDEASNEARACRQFYPITLRMMLQSHPWKFASRTVSLAEVDNDKLGAWAYAYALPGDKLTVRHIRRAYVLDDPSPQTRQQELLNLYEIEGERLYCNLSPCLLHYVALIEDPEKFSSLFVDALAWHLAVRLAMPLTRDPNIRKAAFETATAMQSIAEANEANEERNWIDHDSEMVEVRG